jgi:hypothetical protein
MRRIVLTLLTAAGVAAPFVAQSANAEPICVTVTTTGTNLGSHTVSRCQPYGGGVTCVDRDAGLDPRAHVFVTACVPT